MRTHAILAVVLVISASLLLAQTSLKRFTVAVTDITEAPIPGASVHIQHWDFSGTVSGSAPPKPRLIQDGVATTDANGRASFELAPAQYEVFASAPGFGPAAVSVRNRTEIVFKLPLLMGDGVEVESSPK